MAKCALSLSPPFEQFPDVIAQIMPWDSDIDVQMTSVSVHMLASYYNMTIHSFYVGEGERRDYMLEVNPKYTDPSYDDILNVIDARWIDIETGLFIDITAVRPHKTKKGILCSKDQHEEKVRPSLPSAHSLPPLPTSSLNPIDLLTQNPKRSRTSSLCATPSSKTNRSRSLTTTRAC